MQYGDGDKLQLEFSAGYLEKHHPEAAARLADLKAERAAQKALSAAKAALTLTRFSSCSPHVLSLSLSLSLYAPQFLAGETMAKVLEATGHPCGEANIRKRARAARAAAANSPAVSNSSTSACAARLQGSCLSS